MEYSPTTNEEDPKPKVYLEEKFSFEITRDVLYAKALTHKRWGSKEAEAMDLLLDVYQPVVTTTSNTAKEPLRNCPAILLLFGGGFMEGSKEQNMEETSMAQYYAKRGFVVFVPNYRLTRHRGTIPRSMRFLAIPANIMLFLVNLPILDKLWIAFNQVLKYIERLICFHFAMQQLTQGLSPDASLFEMAVLIMMQNIVTIYPAARDCKAALRWLHAHGSTDYGVNTHYITAAGGSSGGMLATMLGLTTEDQYRDELSLDEDITLSSTHLPSKADVHTVINGFGGPLLADFGNFINGGRSYDSSRKNYPPMLTVHHLLDPIVPYPMSTRMEVLLRSLGTPHELHTIPRAGHTCSKITVNGMSFVELTLRFIVKHQQLILMES